MAALGKILRKGTGGGSSLDSVKYERVNQDPSDNEEEDDDVIVIYQDGVPIEQHQNGNLKKTNKSHGAARSVAEEAIEKGLIQKATVTKTSSDVEVKVMGKHGMLTRTRIACFVLTLILAIGLAFSFVFILPRFQLQGKKVKIHHYKATQEWTREYDDIGTESLVRLVDVDDDGRLDIIHSFIRTVDYASIQLTRLSAKNYCKRRKEEYPCIGIIVAIRGYDGVELWRINSHSGIFEINCRNIDINHDGKMDCIASGRLSTVVAFDPRNGTVFWRGDGIDLVDSWNVYSALVIPDVTHDGVSDVILPHGGDPKYPPTEVERGAGRLILLDGATGKQLGRYLEMPDDKETYMSPVLHTTADGSVYLLFGHGGETVPGSLFAMSLPDYYHYVMRLQATNPVPTTLKGKYKGWDSFPKEQKFGLIQIYKSETQGVMVPPVCVDVNHDGVKDIIMAAYDGNVICYNGETLDKMWTASFPKFESYSTPAPGYFNEDDTLDFMMHFNYGMWPVYNKSVTVIIDGKAGKTLWSMEASQMDMNSDLVVSTTEKNRDIFVFRLQGRKGVKGNKKKKRSVPQYQRYSDYSYEDNGKGRVEDYDYNVNNRARYPPVQQSPYKNPGSLNRSDPPGLRGSANNRRKTYQRYPNAYRSGYTNAGMSDNIQNNWQRLGNGVYGGPTTRFNNENVDYNIGLQVENDDYADDDDDDDDTDDNEEKHSQIPSCDVDVDPYASEIFLMDRSNVMEPLLVKKIPARIFHYNVTEEDLEILRRWKASTEVGNTNSHVGRREVKGQRVRRHGKKEKKPTEKVADKPSTTCSMMKTEERSTGAIGDLDGDGKLDFVGVNFFTGELFDGNGNYIKDKFIMQIFKVNMEQMLKKGKYIGTKIDAELSPEMNKLKITKKIQDLTIKGWKDQPWREYMGSDGTSIYQLKEPIAS